MEDPVANVPKAPSIREGFETFAKSGFPFIVRNVAAFDLDYDQFKARAANEGLKAFGWDKRLTLVSDVSIADAMDQWEKGELRLNFLDCPVPKYVPNKGIHKDLINIGLDEDKLTLLLSNKNEYSPLHQDSVAGGKYGSGAGWMWLLRGSKRWNFLLHDYSDTIFDPVTKALNDIPLDDMVRMDNCKLWGKVMQVQQNAGDFIYFPPGCSHRVWTDEPSFGINGYHEHVQDKERTAKVCAWYKEHGLDPAIGIYRLDRIAQAALIDEERNRRA